MSHAAQGTLRPHFLHLVRGAPWLGSLISLGSVLFVIEHLTAHGVSEFLLSTLNITHKSPIDFLVSSACVIASAIISIGVVRLSWFELQIHFGRNRRLIRWLGRSVHYQEQRIPTDLIIQTCLLFENSKTSPAYEHIHKIVLKAHSAADGFSTIAAKAFADQIMSGTARGCDELLTHYVHLEIQRVLEVVNGVSHERNKNGKRPVFPVDHKWAQMDVAASVASWHATQSRDGTDVNSFCAHATSFDAPSNFFEAYGSKYFEQQEALTTLGDASVFQRFKEVELRYCETSTLTPETKALLKFAEIPSKARMVIISRGTLDLELTDEAKFKAFKAFIKWHATHGFGLRFLIIEDGRKGFDDYAGELREVVQEDDSESIDDFIVYNGLTVFGRTNAAADLPKGPFSTLKVPIRLERGDSTSSAIAAKYDLFFRERLWNKSDSRSPARLFHELLGSGSITPDVAKTFFLEYQTWLRPAH